MKIAQFGRDIADTGGGRVILETSRHMSARGHEVLIVSDVELPNIKAYGLRSITMPLGQTLKLWNPKNRATAILRQFLRMLLFTVYGGLISWKLGRRGWITLNHNSEYLGGDILVLHNVFNHEHKNDSRKISKHLRWINPVFTFRIIRERLAFLLYRNRIWIAVSEPTKLEATPYLGKDTSLSYINNGVNAEIFYPLTEKERIKLKSEMNPPDEFTLLFVGYEFERKGLAYAIEALPSLPKNVHLKVIGGRLSKKHPYEIMAKKLGVEDRVTFLGSFSNITKYYQLADTLILPSAYETWALVGLEAMACGTPALMTEVGGIPIYLRDGENGFFIERNGKCIAAKVSLMLKDAELVNRMRKIARETAEMHSWKVSSYAYLNAIERASAKKIRRA